MPLGRLWNSWRREESALAAAELLRSLLPQLALPAAARSSQGAAAVCWCRQEVMQMVTPCHDGQVQAA